MPQINNLERIYFIFLLGGSVTIYCETCQLLGVWLGLMFGLFLWSGLMSGLYNFELVK